jgi:transcription elongation factor GreA
MSRTPLTRAGAEKLKEELRRLKTVDRPAAIVAIAEARSHGDLSENAEYDAAKDRQGFLEVRIRDIETMLAQAQIVDRPDRCRRPRRLRRDRRPRGPRVRGSRSAINRRRRRGRHQGRQDFGQLSDRAGADRQHPGDTAEVKAPAGLREYDVLAVRYV